MKQVVGVTYDKGLVTGVTVMGIIDDKTEPEDKVEFSRVIHAHWIDNREYCGEFTCKNCKDTCCTNRYPYCPHCGAKMDDAKEG